MHRLPPRLLSHSMASLASRVLTPTLVSVLFVGAASAQLPTPEELAVAHVLRRVTFWPEPGQTQALAQNFPTDALTFLADQRAGLVAEDPGYDTAYLPDFGVPLAATDPPNHGSWTIGDLARQNVGRAIATNNQLREVMTQFWQTHFNTNYGKLSSFLKKAANDGFTDLMVDSSGTLITDQKTRAAAMASWLELRQNLAFREHALGSFRDLLYDSAKGPAMLIYLDGVTNKVATASEKPNENFARELLELHTLGVDQVEGEALYYDEDDIEEVAQALTGWTLVQVPVPAAQGGGDIQFLFDTNLADDGGHIDANSMTLELLNPAFNPNLTLPVQLGGTGFVGEAQGNAILDTLADAYETRLFVCTKLIEYFVGYRPRNFLDPNAMAVLPPVLDPQYDAELGALLFRCTVRWEEGGVSGNISAVLDEIFTSLSFNDPLVRYARIKTPLESIVSTIRAYNAVPPTPGELEIAMDALEADLDQKLFRFPSPDGFPLQNLKQLGTAGYLYRTNFAQSIHRTFVIPDAEGTPGLSYPEGINWWYLRFFMPDLIVGTAPGENANLVYLYLTNYDLAVQSGFTDIGSETQMVARVVDGLFQNEVSGELFAQMKRFLVTMPPTLQSGTLRDLVIASNPLTNPTGWDTAITEHGIRLNQLMSYAASLPQFKLQ